MLSACDLTVEVGGVRVCRDLSVEFRPGESWALLGRNGVGKSTLLYTLAGLRAPRSGEVVLAAKPLRSLSRRSIARSIALLPQNSEDLFPSTVLETALVGRYAHRPFWRLESQQDRDIAQQALRRVDLLDFQHRPTQSLSGGERRRLGIASVLAQDARLFLLDEPTNHLDLSYQIAVLSLFQSLAREEGRASIAVMHDATLAYRFFDHVLLLFGQGESEWGPMSTTLTAGNLERVLSHPIVAIETPIGRAFLPR